MFKTAREQAFIEAIRSLDDNLEKIKLRGIEIDKNKCEVTYNFITDTVVPEEAKSKVYNYVKENTDGVFKDTHIVISKVVADRELVEKTVFYYLKNNCPSITLRLKTEDITVTLGEVNRFSVKVTPSMRLYMERNGTVKQLTEFINYSYPVDFVCELIDIPEIAVGEYVSSAVDSIEDDNYGRIITVKDMVVIDDKYMPDTATYIEDCRETGNYVLCGKIKSLKEKLTKTGKPFFIIRIDDGTGERSGLYFSKESTLSKIKQLKEGDEIIIRGKLQYRDSTLDFQIEKINKCSIVPFEKVLRPTRKVPDEYSVIFPEPYVEKDAMNMFEGEEDLSLFKGTEIVVFDTETTGTDTTKDTAIEIGAYRMKDGVITERFSTFIDPMVRLPERIVEITGITDVDLKGQPKMHEVAPDFMKFIGDAILVGHNVQFDIAIMRTAVRPLGFEIENRCMDTYEMSNVLLRDIKDHKLVTVAKYFNIEFNAHRAYADALVTAKIFKKLVNMRGKLF